MEGLAARNSQTASPLSSLNNFYQDYLSNFFEITSADIYDEI